MKYINIAIDGPAGAGKSTIAKIVAKNMGYTYIDTGAMYRVVALKALKSGINTKDSKQVCSILNNINIDIQYKNHEQIMFLDNINVTDQIRSADVSVAASDVAVIPEVRIKLVDIQRKLATKNNVIMDGRDIGTYVLPNATLKIFLTASIDDRAMRRYEEIKESQSCTLQDVKKDIEYRDKNDSSRDFAPLKKAKDAILVDTSGKELEESVSIIMELVKSIGE